MRIAESLTLPSELELARANGQLVIFAGAGVSMGAPANLPSFKQLARKIAEPKVVWNDSYERSLDRYLGRAEREGVIVQDRARAFLQNQGTHTPLHEYLIGLFSAPEKVCLVTTNFDDHFTSAAEQAFPSGRIRHYMGPALPPGWGFHGIAQLHGSLSNSQDRLVLTDADFASAYMAEGWATRFLVRVFADRTVLFVGYSVEDPLMKYLLHAIPPTGRWYALWHESENRQDSELPIIGITFSSTAHGDKFGNLNDGLKRWRWYARASASDHDTEVRSLIAQGPPTAPQDADYLRARLATDPGRFVFWSIASDLRWFDWAVAEGMLDGLTESSHTSFESAGWTRWCLQNFCGGENPPLLRHLRLRSLELQPYCLLEIIHHLGFGSPLPPRVVLRQLIALIANQPASSFKDPHGWGILLGRLAQEKYFGEAIAVLGVATRLHLTRIERWFLASETPEQGELPPLSTQVGELGPSSDLAYFLGVHGAKLASAEPDRLLMLAERRIREAYELLHLARGTSETWDWLSYGRTAIAPSNQDSMPHAQDVLVDMARLGIDHLASSSPDQLLAFAKRNQNREFKLLHRLALYAYAMCVNCSPDEILRLSVERAWARDYWLRPEWYSVCTQHYPKASEEARAALIKALSDDKWWGEESDEHAAHTRFSLSKKLIRVAPESGVTAAFAEAERIRHPDWGEGDPDGYLSRVEMRWGFDEPSPIEAIQMIGWSAVDASAQIRFHLLRKGEGDLGSALLGAVQQAAQTSAKWAIELFAVSMNGDEIDLQIAQAVLWGLHSGTVEQDDQVELLRKMRGGDWSTKIVSTLALLLHGWAEGLGKEAPAELLDSLDLIADFVFQQSRTESPSVQDEGWTEQAINHPAGRAAEVWWSVANARDWLNGQFVISLDDLEKERWERIRNDDSAAGSFSRPILGMATDRLSAGDFPWSVTQIFPAFDPTSDIERASQLWDGRLMQSQWRRATHEALQPYIRELLRRSAKLVPARSAQLGDWVAFLAVDAERSQLTLKDLEEFVQNASEEARRSFARSTSIHLERLTPDARRWVWQHLLSPYWQDRRTNMPLPLDTGEVREMIGWVIALPEVAEDALAALRESPGQRMEHADQKVRRWKGDKSEWVSAHPREAIGLIGYLADRESLNYWLMDDAVSILSRALSAGGPRELVVQVADKLVELGSQAAAELIKTL